MKLELEILIALVSILIVLFIIFFKKCVPVINSIMKDTLKKDGKWSRTSLTMFSAWIIAIGSYVYDLVKSGFNETAFYVIVGVALGSKLTDALGRNLTQEKAPAPCQPGTDQPGTDQPAPDQSTANQPAPNPTPAP